MAGPFDSGRGIAGRGSRVRVAIAAAALLIVSTACSPGASPSTGGSSAAADPDAILHWVGYATFTSLDPMARGQNGEDALLPVMYDALLARDSANNLVPGLATEWTTTDDHTIRFKLRSGVKFQDDTAFNADAVKFNIERGQTDDASTVKSTLAAVKSVTVVDELTVDINLDPARFGPFLDAMADRAGMMVSPTAVQNAGSQEAFNRNPIGAGMYKVESWEPTVSVTWRKWDGYWDKDAQKLGGIDFVAGASATAGKNALAAGDADYGNVMIGDVESLSTTQGVRIVTRSIPRYRVWIMNEARPPFDDPKVRLAAMYAIDKEAVVKAICAGGTCEVATQPVPKTSWAYSEKEAGLAIQFDQAKARQLLAEAGYPNGGVKFSAVIGAAFPDWVKFQEVIQQQLKQVGFDMSIELLDTPAVLPRLYGTPADGDCGTADASANSANSAGAVDPDAILRIAYLDDGALNVGCWEPDGLRDLVESAAVETSASSRQQAYEDVWALLRESADGSFPLFFEQSYTGYRDYVGGITPGARDSLRGVWISKDKVSVSEG